MFVAIWSPQGVDEGYLNLDTLARFKLETEPADGSTKYLLMDKSSSPAKVWQISGNSYVNIIKSMGKHAF